MIGSAFAFLSLVGGIIYLFGALYIGFFGTYVHMRLTKDKADIPVWFTIVNRFAFFLIIIAGFVYQLFDKSIGGFLPTSYTIFATLAFIWGYGIF
jgi:hypothetical protein